MRASVLARVAAFVAALGVAGLAAAAPALAHDELTGSDPAAGAVVRSLPVQVRLFFQEPPEPAPISVHVAGPDGRPVDAAGPRLSGSTITVPLARSTRAGTYAVGYRIMSDDGHPVSGTIRFTVALASPLPSAATPCATAARPGHGAVWIAAGAGLLVIGSAVAAAVALRRRPSLAPLTEPAPEPELARR